MTWDDDKELRRARKREEEQRRDIIWKEEQERAKARRRYETPKPRPSEEDIRWEERIRFEEKQRLAENAAREELRRQQAEKDASDRAAAYEADRPRREAEEAVERDKARARAEKNRADEDLIKAKKLFEETEEEFQKELRREAVNQKRSNRRESLGLLRIGIVDGGAVFILISVIMAFLAFAFREDGNVDEKLTVFIASSIVLGLPIGLVGGAISMWLHRAPPRKMHK